VADDVGERRDLAEPLAAKAAQLRQELHAWLEAAGAQMPQPNPKYDPSQPEDPRFPDADRR
jgi:hypothetical protein